MWYIVVPSKLGAMEKVKQGVCLATAHLLFPFPTSGLPRAGLVLQRDCRKERLWAGCMSPAMFRGKWASRALLIQAGWSLVNHCSFVVGFLCPDVFNPWHACDP